MNVSVSEYMYIKIYSLHFTCMCLYQSKCTCFIPYILHVCVCIRVHVHKFYSLYLTYMCTYQSTYTPCACGRCWAQIPWNWSYSHLWGAWYQCRKTNPGPLYQENVLFTSKPSLHRLENSRPAYYTVTRFSLTPKEPQNKISQTK